MSVAQLVTTVIFFSAWEKSCVKWEKSLNSTQRMRTIAWSLYFRTKCLLHAFMQWNLNFNSGMQKVHMILLLVGACLSFWPWVWFHGYSDTFYNKTYRFKSSLVLIYVLLLCRQMSALFKEIGHTQHFCNADTRTKVTSNKEFSYSMAF